MQKPEFHTHTHTSTQKGCNVMQQTHDTEEMDPPLPLPPSKSKMMRQTKDHN